MDKEYGIVLDVDLSLYKAKMNEAMAIAQKVSDKTQGTIGGINLNLDTTGVQSSLDGLKDKIVEIKDELQRVNAQNLKNSLSSLGGSTSGQGLFSSLFFSNAKTGLSLIKSIGTTLKIGLPIAIGIGLINKLYNHFKTKAEEARKRTEALKKIFLNVFASIGNGAKRVLENAANYIVGFFNKALNSYMSFDQQLAKNIQNVWVGLGSFLAPILEYVVSLFQRLLAYVNATIKVLTGVDFIARANAKAMNGVASSTAKAVKALAGFDELQNINQESGAGGGGITGSTIEIPDVDTSNIENFAKRIKKLIEQDNWEEIGITVRDKIIDALLKINWADIQVKAEEIGRKFAEFLNGLMKPKDDGLTLGAVLGKTLANAINTALYFLDGFFKTISAADLAQNIIDLIVNTIEGIDWNKATDVLQKAADALLDLLEKSLDTLQEKLPEWMDKIKAYFQGEKGRKLLETIAKIILKYDDLREVLHDWFKDLLYMIYEEYEEAQARLEEKAKAEPLIKKVEDWLVLPETSEVDKKNKETLRKKIEDFRKNADNMSSAEIANFYSNLNSSFNNAKKGTDLDIYDENGLIDFGTVKENTKKGFGDLGNLGSTEATNSIKKTSTSIKTTIEEEGAEISELNYNSSLDSWLNYNEGAEDVDNVTPVKLKMSSVSNTIEEEGIVASKMSYTSSEESWKSYNEGADSVDTTTPARDKIEDILGAMNEELDISGGKSKKTEEMGDILGSSLNSGYIKSDAVREAEEYFDKVFNAVNTSVIDAQKETEKGGQGLGSTLGGGIGTGFDKVIRNSLEAVKRGLNEVIALFNKSADNIGRNYNVKVKGSIAEAGNAAASILSNVTAQIQRVPYLRIGTNEVYSEGLAYLHAGEKIVPADVAKGGYDSSDNKETNMLLRVLIDTLENKEFRASIGKDDVGRASVDYINKMKRITGGSVV